MGNRIRGRRSGISDEADAGAIMSELQVDGGAAANDLLMQLQVNILGIPVVRPIILKSVEEIAVNWKVDRRFEPQMAGREAAKLCGHWNEAVERSKT